MDHLLLIMKVIQVYVPSYKLDLKVVLSTVEWYQKTLTAMSQGEESTVKELTLTVMVLDDPNIVNTWVKVDDILSIDVFRTLEHVHFLYERKTCIRMCSTVCVLQQVLLKLWRGGKWAV